MRDYTKVTITRKGEKMARGGHPWVFGDEVLDIAGPVENGDLVDVVSEKKGKYIGTGFYNDHSKIRVRLLSRNANDRFDEAFSNGGSSTPWITGKPSCPGKISKTAG